MYGTTQSYNNGRGSKVIPLSASKHLSQASQILVDDIRVYYQVWKYTSSYLWKQAFPSSQFTPVGERPISGILFFFQKLSVVESTIFFCQTNIRIEREPKLCISQTTKPDDSRCFSDLYQELQFGVLRRERSLNPRISEHNCRFPHDFRVKERKG